MEGTQTYSVELGALTDVPCWESHKRGKNWFATIHRDPNSPGGLGRTFHKPGKGEFFYLIDGVNLHDAVEFGADYYSGSGNPSRKRVYGVVTAITKDEDQSGSITIEWYETAIKACKAAAELRKAATLEPVTA